ncbi:hypothetical protein LJC41_09150, partial [Desulfosarcina sp. OttesenSCG-928-G17]|nr:hypothetical protein [Desulfosarcina sp. OttesenSCG-928-G17]
QTAIGKRPKGRWKGANAVYTAALDHLHPAGAFVDTVKIRIGEFQIPPAEIDSILPQQLLALKAGAAALADAGGMALHEARPRMGVVMGMGFDFEATNFHLRWQLFSAVQRWRTQYGLAVMDEAEMDTWLEALRDGCGPPLTAPRVMGALGGIVASRMAREFRFGAPSFGICADAASGTHALQVAMDRLRHKEADAMLVGAVDLSGEGRNLVRMNPWLSLSPSNQVRPFDTTADGTLPGDGAVALVIKPLSAAQAAGDRIYAIIQGIGSAGGGNPITGKTLPEVYTASLSRCFASTDITPGQVSYIETHGSGVPDQDQMEQAALNAFFADPASGDPARDDPAEKIAIGSAKPFFGHTGIADGLVSLVKAALCLHRKILPALPGFVQSGPPSFSEKKFHVPQASQPWYQDRDAPPRTALVSALTIDGACGHVLLQEARTQTTVAGLPDSTDGPGLFVLTGHTPGHLKAGLSELEAFLNTPDAACQPMARRWMRAHPADARHELAICLLMSDLASENQAQTFSQARQAIETGQSDPLSRSVFYTAAPMGKNARIAMVYPGSGNHYLGMGRDLGLRFPGIIARMAQDTARLKTQMRPWVLMPWEINWASGWRTEAEHRLVADPLNMIFGQVVYGDLMTRVLNQFSIPVHALIGYSLGETASLFAHGIWKDRGDMLFRMQDSDLFSTQLAGPCHALRNAWHIPDTDPVVWQVAVVNRPAEAVKSVISRIPHVRLLIVNTPDECVIAGTPAAMAKTISRLECKAIYLDGVITVHCDALGPVADTYRYLHFFPATPKPGLTVYSCGWAAPYAALTADTIADAIMKQAMDGFDFTQTIRRAYDDGITVFIETGPKGSCTRMINRILDGAPHHLAVTANPSGEGEIAGLLRCLARLESERVPLDLSPLYADDGSDLPV